jgi:NAD(P)H dehydrogenase (quinone)
MIVVTGATGKLGSRVVHHLLSRTAASNIVACVRKPDQANDFVAKGVAVRKGDYDDPEGLAKVFAGADQLLLVSASGIALQSRVNKHRSAIRAAKAAGVGQVFYTSLLPGNDSVAYVQRAHIETERSLKDSGFGVNVKR